MSNILNLPPNHHDGIYKGFLHKDGGIQSILENGKKLEIEKDEFHICSAVLQSDKTYEFKNATNKEILTKLFQDSHCIFEQGKSFFGDFIICRLVVLDDKKRNLTGTAKEIINILQSEKSCNVTEDSKEEFKKELGGNISKKDFDKVTIKYKGLIPYVADSYSQKFNQKATLLRDYSNDTVVNENGKTDFKEPKYYSYGYLKAGTSLGTKRGWTLNLPKKGMSIEMQYHPQQFEEVKDLYWVFEGRVFPFPEDAKIEAKKITEKNQSFRDEYNLGNSLWGYGKKSYIAFNDSEVAAVETYYDSTIEKSNKYYAVYFGDEKNGLYEKALITHSLPNAYLYARQFDVNQAYLVTIENGKVTDSSDIYPYSESTDLQQIAKDWLNEYYGLKTNETDLEKGIKVEEEHRDTVEKLAKGEISADEGVKQIASAHLAEDPAYYDKLETVESPFYKFIEIVDTSKDFDEAYSKAKQIKDVPSEVATAFYEKYNPEGKLSMEQSFRKLYDEHKKDDLEFKVVEQELPFKDNPNAKWVKVTHVDKNGNTFMQGVAIDLYVSKEKAIDAAKEKIKAQIKKDSEKQELQDLIDLFKEAVKENPNDQESKDLLELYEENLKELNAKFESGGSINRKLTYLGEVGGDKIGQKSSLEKAKLLEKQGVSSEQIRQETGWFLNPHDKKWRFEISDEDFEIIYDFDELKPTVEKNGKRGIISKISKFIKHDKLFEAYPEFKDLLFCLITDEKRGIASATTTQKESKKNIAFIYYNLHNEKQRIREYLSRRFQSNGGKTERERGLYESARKGTKNEGAGFGISESEGEISSGINSFRKNILIHELQHLIQIREGFGGGSSPIQERERLLIEKQIKWEDLSDIQKTVLDLDAKKYYENASGEIESIDVDNRLYLNNEERKKTEPLSSVKINNSYLTSIPEDPIFEKGGELNAEEAILNSPCINKKFKFVESSDYNEYRKGGEIGFDKKSVFKEWNRLVNMSAKEVKDFLETEEGKEAGLSKKEANELGIHYGRESANWIIKMKSTPVSEWTSEMWDWAKRQIAFIKRMSGNEGKLYDEKGNKTRKYTSLLVWGNDPEKYSEGGEINKVNSLKELLNLEKEDAIKIIEDVLRGDSFYKELQDNDYEKMSLSAYKFCKDFLYYNHENPIKSKLGDLVYFDPDKRSVDREGYLLSQIKYATHQVTRFENELKLNRVYDKSKDELFGMIAATLFTPDSRAVDADDENKIYYYKEIGNRKNTILLFKAEIENDGHIQYITVMPNKKNSHWKSFQTGENEKKEVRYNLASPLSQLPPTTSKDDSFSERTEPKSTRTVNDLDFNTNIQIKNGNMQEKNEKFSQGGEIQDVIFLVEPYFDENKEKSDVLTASLNASLLPPNTSVKDAHVRGIYKVAIEHSNTTKSDVNMENKNETTKFSDENFENTLFAHGGKIEVNKVCVYQTAFYGLSFADSGSYFESKFTDVIDLEDKNVILKDAPVFLFFKNPYDTRYSEKIYIDDVIGAIIPKKMEKDARAIFDKRYISYVTYSDDSSDEGKIEAIKKLAEINEDIILK